MNLFFIIYLLFCHSLTQKLNDLREENKQLELKLKVSKDTFDISEKLILSVSLKNISRKILYIPDTFSVTSNFYPQGIDATKWNGANIHFEVQPISSWAGIYVENMYVIDVKKFIKLYPLQEIVLQYNIREHLARFYGENEKAYLQSNKKYTIKCYYFYNGKKYKSKMFFGKTNSDSSKVYLKGLSFKH